jgi:heme-degrading monooxygenase HmoA
MPFANLMLVIVLTVQAQNAEDARSLIHQAQDAMKRVAALAAQGQFVTATELVQAAMKDMDRAVSLARNDPEVRIARGLAYAAFPPYYGEADIGRDDLKAAVAQPQFANLPEDQRNRVLQALERPSASSRPDRFPNIPADTSPIVVAVSITYAESFAAKVQRRIEEIGKSVERFPGLLGKHVLTSLDKPGMFIIFTWWKDKHAASDFYYSELHQSWMRGRGQANLNHARELLPWSSGTWRVKLTNNMELDVSRDRARQLKSKIS